MHKHLYITTNDTKNISALLSTSPSDALKQLICNESQGIDTSEYINNTIKTILQTKPSNQTLKYFYTYISLIPKKDKEGRILGEVLLLTNQIRKDLQSMNEYIRGIAMQTVITFLELPEIIDNFYKPVKENIQHKHSYVRKWAAHVLGEFYKSNKEKYEEVIEIIYNAFILERDPFCMREMINTLYKISPQRIIEYKPIDVPTEVSDIIIANLDKNYEYLLSFLAKNPYYTGIRILKESSDASDKSLTCVLEALLNCSRKEDALKFLIDNNIDVPSGYLLNVLKICKKNESLFKYPDLIEFLFEIANLNEIDLILEVLLVLLKESNFKLFLIQKLNFIFNFYAITNFEIIEEIQKLINSNEPAICYESLKFLSEQKNVIKNIKLENIKFGKIFRKALNILKDYLSSENEVAEILNLLELKIQDSNTSDTSAVLDSLYSAHTPFIGCNVALFFDSLNKKISFSDSFKAKIIAVLLKFIILGDKTKKMDKSSHTLILLCIKNIYTESNVRRQNTASTITDNNTVSYTSSTASTITDNNTVSYTSSTASTTTGNNTVFNTSSTASTTTDNNTVSYTSSTAFDVFDGSVHYSLLGRKKQSNIHVCKSVNTVKFCKPLTAISDPVYLEASISIQKYNILIDIIVINQTDSLLQNLNFDFTTSSNLSLQSQNNLIPNLIAGSVKNITFNYSIQECANAFLCGNVKFNFLNERKVFSGSFYTVNLDEIKFNIKDFLTPSNLNNELNFREEWLKLEWENTYSVKLNCKKDLSYLRNLICKKLKGKVLSEEGDNTYLVSNIVCGTLLGDDILINILMSCSDVMNLECRVRSGTENIVKSISTLISDGIKGVI